MILTLAVSGYRSLRDLILPLGQLTIVTGPNGSGKSSFYKSLRLLADVAQGRVIQSLAREGGLQSTLWAGPEVISRGMISGETPIQGTVRKGPTALKLGFSAEDYGYAVDLGLPQPSASQFSLDPEIKLEAVWAGEKLRRTNVFAERRGPVVTILNQNANRDVILKDIASYDSMMTHAADPKASPELLNLRERMRSWRFYDHFRSDADAPSRRPQVGTRTPIMASDGSDVAAALQTIIEVGDRNALDAALDDAFRGAHVEVGENQGMFEVLMGQPGLLRPLNMTELSDGTLRYLLLVTALLTPRPPELLVLNEPETSLHPDLMEPLARLIKAASLNAQVIVVSHSAKLVDALRETEDTHIIRLEKRLGETIAPESDPSPWSWPKR